MPKLTGLVIDRIAIVDKGDNPKADIVLWKRKKDDDMTEKELQEKLKAAEKAAQDAKSEADKAVEASKKRIAELEAKMDKSKDPPPDPLEKADPAVKEAVAALKKEADEAKKAREEDRVELQKIKEANAHAAMVKRVGDELSKFAQADDLAGILRKAEGALSKEENDKLWQTLKAANAQIDHSALLKELGVDGGDEADAAAKLEAMAKTHQEKNNVSYEQAYAAVCKTDEGKELYKAYETAHEQKGR